MKLSNREAISKTLLIMGKGFQNRIESIIVAYSVNNDSVLKVYPVSCHFNTVSTEIVRSFCFLKTLYNQVFNSH